LRKVDVDAGHIKAEERGSDLAVECPHCGKGFLLARVKEARQALETATHGYKEDNDGTLLRVKL
jgi:ribosomal protein S27AE